MHYIRLLRPPAIEQRGGSRHLLKIVLAITTDLGDAYLSPKEPIELSVIGAHRDVNGSLRPIILTQNATPRWRAGMRVLKFDLPLPPDAIKTIQIRPTNRQLIALSTTDVYRVHGGEGLIMGVYADMPSTDGKPSLVCFRSLRLVGSDGSAPINALQVEEDFGDSIARHVWDGGIATISFIADICFRWERDSRAGGDCPMPLFSSILRQSDPLNVIELGCGVGIVGIGLSRILQASPYAASPKVLVTDLAEAEERAEANISRYLEDMAPSEQRTSIIEFESLDWHEGKNGAFGEGTQSLPWDLIIVSECTYNTDTLLALVQTLSALHSHSAQSAMPRDTKVFLATKPRHSSEREFFTMMAAERWVVSEKTVVPLPVIGSDAQLVEMYLFSRK